MGRGPKRPRKPLKNAKKTSADDDDVFAGGTMDDEIDAYHRQRDVVPLDPNGGDSDSSDAEQPVFNLGGDNIDDTESGSTDDDDGDDIDDDIQPNKLSAKIARTKKYLKQKFGGSDDEMHDDDDEEEDKEEQRKAAWGGRKTWYYDADNADYELQSSDEELPMEEEAEAVKIQKEKAKFLSLEDFGLEEADEDGSNSDAKEKKQKAVLDGKRSGAKLNIDGLRGDNALENFGEIKKDLNSLSKEEQMDAVYSSAPEIVGLLAELNEALMQLQKVEPLVCEVKERRDGAKGRMHYLEVKRLLLLSYCQAIVFYLLLKSEGHPVQDHPVVGRLVEIKALMEQMNQIEANLPSQFDKNFIPNAASEPTDKLVHQPEVANVPKKTHDSLVEVSNHLLSDSSLQKDHNKHVSQKDQNDRVGIQSMEMLKVRANLEAKLKQKGLFNFTNSKDEIKQKNSSKPLNKYLETRDDFDDEVQPVANGGTHSISKVTKLIPNKGNKSKFVSGDDDVPMRDDIGERRRKHELRVLARAGTVSMDDDIGPENKSVDTGAYEDDGTTDSEDDFYKEVKKQRTEKLSAKAELYSRTSVAPSPLESEVGGKRQITYQIEKNKGLTRHRKKLTKIPRKKYKIKHQKAVIRRKGQVRDIRKPTGPYGGEATGINAGISRSVRFKG
ncbi:putative sas10 domain-containing protein [Dioscorea sansibarensis]